MSLPDFLLDPRFWIGFWSAVVILVVYGFVSAIREDWRIQRMADEVDERHWREGHWHHAHIATSNRRVTGIEIVPDGTPFDSESGRVSADSILTTFILSMLVALAVELSVAVWIGVAP
jgi:hypothetical protein